MGGKKEMDVVKGLDLQRYMGRWYEIASFLSRFQPKNGINTRATYTLNDDGTIQGSAYKADPESDEAKLKVKFYVPPFLPIIPVVGDYWVLYIDQNYQYALIGQHSRNYLWVLKNQIHVSQEPPASPTQAAHGVGTSSTWPKWNVEVKFHSTFAWYKTPGIEVPEDRVVAVLMVGGPTKGTSFRPLSFNIPKPLFPLAGQPMVYHPISACKRIPNLAQIYLIGFYEEREFALFVSSVSNELKVPVRYLREDKPHGSAGGLYNFRDLIMEDNPSQIVLLNCDVCCSFPLPDMLDVHKTYGGMGTILVSKVSTESASQFGELVADPETNELLHYTEKPETFVSDLINCGVYIFTTEIFSVIQDVPTIRRDRATLRHVSSFEALQSATKTLPMDFVRLDQDILSPLAGKKKLYTYETLDFWEQIKTPGMSLRCSGLYLSQFRHTSPGLLATVDGTRSPTIVGDVYIHPSAKVHRTAKIGPNVSISANARIGAGARLSSCIILDDVEVKEHALIMHSIVGWKSSIGKWSRVQGVEDYFAKLGITILGESVIVEDEVVVGNCIVLPNKTLNMSVHEEIIL